MAILKQYFARKKLQLILPHLPGNQRSLLGRIIELLEPDGSINAGTLRDDLFPLAGSDNSKNTMLRRLLDNITAIAKQHGMNLVAATTADKKAGANRKVWFEGDAPDTARPDTSDLNRVPEQVRVRDQRGQILGQTVLLMTFNEIETRAVLDTFASVDAPVEMRDGISYTRLGIHGKLQVVHVMSRQARSEAQASAQAAIAVWRPCAIIPVGVAFGIDPAKQSIGDVLVSEYLRDYEVTRVNPDASLTTRGNRPQASDQFLNLLRRLDATRNNWPDWPKLHIGVVMSGDKLVDNRAFRDQLLKMEPEAIGGEMEGIGVETAARKANIDWIIIKGICDWADGQKNTSNKAADQQRAATHAALVVKAMLETPGLFDQTDTFSRPDPLTPAQPPATRERCAPHPRNMGLHDRTRVGDAEYQAEFIGQISRLDEAANRAEQGVAVLPYLHEWIKESGAPPLFALLGEYGMGKTLTCQQLTLELQQARSIDPNQPIALYFDLRHVTGLKEKVPTLAQTLEECMQRGWLDEGDAGAGFTLESIHEWISQGAVVIFDGLDEVLVKLNQADGQTFTNTLLKLFADARRRAENAGRKLALKIIISCRTQYFPTLQAQNNHFTQEERGEFSGNQYRALLLSPWTPEQIKCYFANAMPNMPVDKILEMVAATHNLTELTQRPYTLKLVAEFIPDIERDRANGRKVFGVTLYRKMAEKWLARDSGKHHIEARHKMRLAMDLAAHLWRNGKNALPVGELNDWFHGWRDADASLRTRYQNLHPDQLEEDLRTATFLARTDEEAGSTFRFAHTSLLEFFLASYLQHAVKADQAAQWAMPVPSKETLDFFGQLLAEEDTALLLTTLQGWRKQYRPQCSELLLAYAQYAHAHALPLPILHGIDLHGADLAEWEIAGREGAVLVLGPANFAGCNLRDATLQSLGLEGANFSNADLGGGNLLDCEASGANFAGAQLDGSIFRHCNLEATQWDNAEGHRPQWLACQPAVPRWQAANLDEALSSSMVLPTARQVAWFGWDTRFNDSIVWSPAGRWLAGASTDHTIRLLDTLSGEVCKILAVQGYLADGCRWSPDGTLLAVGRDFDVQIWDAERGELLVTLLPPSENDNAIEIASFCWSPDCLFIAVTGCDQVPAWIFEVTHGEMVRTLAPWNEDGVHFPVPTFSWGAQGQLAGGGELLDHIYIWDANTGALINEFPCANCKLCVWSPDGKQLATMGDGQLLRIWDASGKLILTIEAGSAHWDSSFAWAPNCNWIFIGHGLNRANGIWDAQTGEKLCSLPSTWTGGGVWSPDSRRIALAGFGRVTILDLFGKQNLTRLDSRTEMLQDCAWSPDGKDVISVGNSLIFWMSSIGKFRLAEPSLTVFIQIPPSFSTSWRYFSFCNDNEIIIREVGNDKSANYCRMDGFTTTLAWAHHGDFLAVATVENKIYIFEPVGATCVQTLAESERHIHAVTWLHDGMALVSTGDGKEMRIWDIATGKSKKRTLAFTAFTCTTAPNGSTLALGGDDGMVHLWAVEKLPTEKNPEIQCLQGHTASVKRCAWAPDGTQLVSASDDSTLRIWDVATGACLHVLAGHRGPVRACAWSPDGQFIASVGADNMMRIWAAPTGKLIRIHAQCKNHYDNSFGHAVWEPDTGRIIETSGDAWRYLGWQARDEQGNLTRYPLQE